MSGKRKTVVNKDLFPSLVDVISFRQSGEHTKEIRAFISTPLGQAWMAVMRNYCLLIGGPGDKTTAEFELGRAFGKSEMLSVMLSCAVPITKQQEVPVTYEPDNAEGN